MLYVEDVRDTWIYGSTFRNHEKSSTLRDHIIAQNNNATFLYKFPEEYFLYAHDNMIRIEQRGKIGLQKQFRTTLKGNTFNNNTSF